MSHDTGKMTMMRETLKQLHETLSEQAGVEWLFAAVDSLRTESEPLDQLSLFSAMAIRKLGDNPVATGGSLVVEAEAGQIDISRWSVGDCGRVFLVMSLVAEGRQDAGSLVSGLYRLGDERERAALVRGLALFSSPEEHKPVALDAGRTNSVALFKALALDNPYPAAYYSEHEFNQMVLKALFMQITISRVHGLAERANPALSVMCENYHDERRLAGRDVPGDIWLALGPCATDNGEQMLVNAAGAMDPTERAYACQALAQRVQTNPRLKSVLEQRLTVEEVPEILECLKRYLGK